LLKTVLLRVVCIFFPAAAINALLPVVVRDTLDLGSGGYGLLLGCFGLGAVLAAVARPALERRASTEAQLLAASATLTVVLVVQGAVHQAAVVGAALFIAGFAWSSASTLLGVAAQSALPSWVRARGMALYLLALTGAIAVGSALWGSLASWNLTGAHLIAAAAVGCGALAAWRWRISWSFDLDLTQVAGDAPEVAWVPEPTDGPVLVTVTYDVAPAKTIEFATLMRDMEDHRRRTGAYRWGLFRDVAEPDRFLETFVVDSWAEHLRQHHRTTVQISAFLELVSQHAVAERAVSHYISSSSPGALAPRERSPELADLREDGAEEVPSEEQHPASR
jgi:quinol monooxygenase YgiN